MVITNQRFHGQMWINMEGYDYGQSDKTLLPIISKTIYIENTNKYGGEKFSPLYKVNLAYTPVGYPVCGFTNKTNRQYAEALERGQCGFAGGADHVVARSIVERVVQEHPSLRPVLKLKTATKLERNIGERVARSNPSLRLITPELPHMSINVGGD